VARRHRPSDNRLGVCRPVGARPRPGPRHPTQPSGPEAPCPRSGSRPGRDSGRNGRKVAGGTAAGKTVSGIRSSARERRGRVEFGRAGQGGNRPVRFRTRPVGYRTFGSRPGLADSGTAALGKRHAFSDIAGGARRPACVLQSHLSAWSGEKCSWSRISCASMRIISTRSAGSNGSSSRC
jgi:hypothetical protein